MVIVAFYNDVIVGQEAFYSCDNLANVIFNAGGSIGINSFSNLSRLESVVFSEGISSIGANAFANCDMLKTIDLPSSLTSIGENVFKDCDLLESVTIGDNLSIITSGMFMNCDSLKYVEMGDSINTIASSAFYNCKSLEEIKLSDNLMVIGDNVFYNCISLKELNLPEGLVTIGNNAFYNLSSLVKIMLPSSITSIPAGLLNGASNLKVLVIPFIGTDQYATIANANTLLGAIFGTEEYDNSVAITQYYSSEGSATYYYPINLERVEVTNASIIHYGAFSYIASLKEIMIHNSVTTLDNFIFNGLENLELVYYRGLETEWNNVTKMVNYNVGANYELRFVPSNLVRVSLIDSFNNRLACTVTLLNEEGTTIKYEGRQTYFGSALENVLEGTYLLKVTYDNFVKEELITVDGDEEFIYHLDNLDILEQFKDRELIIVLTWGENPRDLDSHMVYTNTDSTYHVYYANQVDTNTGTNLDIDDITSYGPEVITVLELQEGIYTYSVYDYTHSGSLTSNGITTSGAHVAVYIDGELIASYDAPTTGNGCLWNVFKYNGTTGEISTINTISGGMSSSEVISYC